MRTPAQIAQLLTIKREREIVEGVSKRESRRKDKCAPARPWLDGDWAAGMCCDAGVLCCAGQTKHEHTAWSTARSLWRYFAHPVYQLLFFVR